MNRFILLLTLILAGCSDSKKYTVQFDDVERLHERDAVLINDNPVGEVTDVEVKDGKVLVTVSVPKEIKVTAGSKFILQQDLIMQQHIEIELANENNNSLDPSQLQTGVTRPLDTTGFRKITSAQFDSMVQVHPHGKVIDTLFTFLKQAVKTKTGVGIDTVTMIAPSHK